MDNNPILRYSDAELDEFREIIETKLRRATKHLTELQEQIVEITENTSDEHGGDWVDDSSINNDVEMLNNMAIRQRVHIQDLQNAFVRIKNKSYGICIVTGELIDKRRLLAVPTTTKSMAAKVSEQQQQPQEKKIKPIQESSEERKDVEKVIPQKRIITTVIRKSSPNKKKPAVDPDDFDDDLLGVSSAKDAFGDDDSALLYGDVSDLDDDIADDSSDMDDNDSYDERDDSGDDDDDFN
jgi:RNA polymerase-binding transcription factor DksA